MWYCVFVGDGLCHGKVIEEFGQAASMIDVDVGKKDQIDPADAHGREGTEKAFDWVGGSDIDDNVLFPFNNPGPDESIKIRSIQFYFHKHRIHKSSAQCHVPKGIHSPY